jgi:hypothetical protein
MEYKKSKRLLLKDLRSFSNKDVVSIHWGNKKFTPSTLADEIENETEIGKEHIQMHLSAMKIIEEIKRNRSLKKKNGGNFGNKLNT